MSELNRSDNGKVPGDWKYKEYPRAADAEVKICPGCGDNAEIIIVSPELAPVICKTCSFSAESLENWNARTEDPRVKGLVEALTDAYAVLDAIATGQSTSAGGKIFARKNAENAAAALAKWREGKGGSFGGGTKRTQAAPHWPIGTNLFTAYQAREMIEHLLADDSQETPK